MLSLQEDNERRLEEIKFRMALEIEEKKAVIMHQAQAPSSGAEGDLGFKVLTSEVTFGQDGTSRQEGPSRPAIKEEPVDPDSDVKEEIDT